MTKVEKYTLSDKLVQLFLCSPHNHTSKTTSPIQKHDQYPQITQEKGIFDRLYSENQRKKEALQIYEVRKRDLELQGCTFKPYINENTQALAANHIMNVTNKKFLQRSHSQFETFSTNIER